MIADFLSPFATPPLRFACRYVRFQRAACCRDAARYAD